MFIVASRAWTWPGLRKIWLLYTSSKVLANLSVRAITISFRREVVRTLDLAKIYRNKLGPDHTLMNRGGPRRVRGASQETARATSETAKGVDR